MAPGATSYQNRRKDDIIGNNLPDPFLDSYREEMYTAYDIIEMVDMALTQKVNIVIDKDFLRKLAKSHINFIKEMEKAIAH